MFRRILIAVIIVLMAVALYKERGRINDRFDSFNPWRTMSIEFPVQKTIGSVVHIRNETRRWQGSGFAISPTLIVTARHVVDGGEDFTITTNDGIVIKSARAISSEKYDAGFIEVNEPILQPVRVGSIGDCKVGQFLYAIGSPYGKPNFNSVTFGIISALDRDFSKDVPYGWSTLFQTDTPGHPGNSGCPVFTLDGVVRGILVGGMSNNIIYCVPVDVFMDDVETIELMFDLNRYYVEIQPWAYAEGQYYEDLD